MAMFAIRHLPALIALVAPTIATAQVVQPAPPARTAPVAGAPGERDSYVLGKGDTVEVSVLGRSDYSAKVQIQDDGNIALPYINAVPAAGLTVLQLRDNIARSLQSGGYFTNPAVNVAVTGFGSRYVTVLGQVRTPGVVAIDREYRLSEIIARSGGVAAPEIDVITITRADGTSTDVSLSAIATGGPAADPVVRDGDKVFVSPSKTFYIYGQVNAPGVFPVVPNMTIRMAVARAGGLTALGSEKRIKLIRGEAETKPSLTEALRPGDVLVVGERFF